MDQVFVECDIRDARSSEYAGTVPHLLVDNGSPYTWIDETVLRNMGVRVEKEMSFLRANGQMITRSIGYAILAVEDFCETIDEVVFAKSGDLQLLGSRPLNGLRALPDTDKKRLVDAGPIYAVGMELDLAFEEKGI